ncbi:DNA-processing protein DprA [Candidatus Peregrinibacteria bacterium]|nr:DNA-processing protein DprA [Candidatus Peregrinibacteria bacterium]
MDEYIYLWAQWGILRTPQYEAVINRYGNLKEAWHKITPEFLLKCGFGADKVTRAMQDREALSFHYITQKLEETGARILYKEDKDYPFLLSKIADPPPFLFVRGKLPNFHKSLSIVGTRAITDYGRQATEKFTEEFVHNGFVIVSGLALGVDACAHHAALKHQGLTVAVLGCGVDEIYPLENVRLAESILESGGAIVSEYPLGAPALRHHFPERNRIIAGLTRGTLVIEGGTKSGALITARLALEYNRDVFAVPHEIIRAELNGANHLIKNSKAKLVERAADILEDFQMSATPCQLRLDFNEAEKTLLNLLATGGKTIDDLSPLTPYSVPALTQRLIALELKGVVKEQGARWVLT